MLPADFGGRDSFPYAEVEPNPTTRNMNEAPGELLGPQTWLAVSAGD